MINIRPLCKMFGKRPSHFLDNAIMVGQPFETRRGPDGYTKISNNLLPQFYLWLSTDTRQMVLNGAPTENITKYVNALPTPKKKPK